MADDEPITRGQMWAVLKTILALVVVTFVLNVVTAYQVNETTHNVDAVKGPVAEAQRAATEASRILTAAVNNPNAAQQQAAVQAALTQIDQNTDSLDRLENRLCGGPCPEPKPEG